MTDPLLASTYSVIQERVDYLTARTSIPTEGEWWACSDLLEGGDPLREVMFRLGHKRGALEEQPAASLFFQAYAFRLPAIALAAYALDMPGPSIDPGDCAIGMRLNRPGAVAYLNPAAVCPDAAELAAAVAEHLQALAHSICAVTRVGERMLAGNAAASLASGFRAIESGSPDRALSIRARAEEFFAESAWLDGLGWFESPEEIDGPRWGWQRTNCCLWYQTNGDGALCEGCSLRR